MELSYVNSNLQLLKEELAELSSSVDVDQPEGCEMPGGARTHVWRVHLGGGNLRVGLRAAMGLEPILLVLVKVLLSP